MHSQQKGANACRASVFSTKTIADSVADESIAACPPQQSAEITLACSTGSNRQLSANSDGAATTMNADSACPMVTNPVASKANVDHAGQPSLVHEPPAASAFLDSQQSAPVGRHTGVQDAMCICSIQQGNCLLESQSDAGMSASKHASHAPDKISSCNVTKRGARRAKAKQGNFSLKQRSLTPSVDVPVRKVSVHGPASCSLLGTSAHNIV